MARLNKQLEDDITFERVRSMPRRTRVCSIHRQLSWACTKEVQIYERGNKVTMNGLDRSRSAMQGRAKELRTLQHKLSFSNSTGLVNRRASCPPVLTSSQNKRLLQLAAMNAQTTDEDPDGGHHVTDKDVVKGSSISLQRKAALPRSVSINVRFGGVTNDDNKTKKSADANNNDDDDVDREPPKIPTSVLQRRKTMPNL